MIGPSLPAGGPSHTCIITGINIEIPFPHVSVLSVVMKLRKGNFAEKRASSALTSMISDFQFYRDENGIQMP